MSIADRIDQAALDEPEASWLASLWETSGSAYLDEVGLAAALRWFALAGFSYELMIDCVSRFKIARGTRALVEAIAGDGGAEIRLESPVAAVEHDGRRVAVSLRGGGTVEASVAVVALPLNVLGSIEFDPPLSEGKREAAAAGQASHGIKIWVRARGELGRAAIAAPGTAINYMQPEYRVEGDTLLVGFGPDSALLDPEDEAAVLAAAAAVPGRRPRRRARPRLGRRRVREGHVVDVPAGAADRLAARAPAAGGARGVRRLGRRERLERLRRRGHRERPVGLADGSCADRRRWPVVCRQ